MDHERSVSYFNGFDVGFEFTVSDLAGSVTSE